MADQQIAEGHAKKSSVEESKQHGCFDFMIKKKDDKTHQEEKDDGKDAHSTSSSEEEQDVEEGGERKKKKKKGLKEAIKEKVNGSEEETECVPMEKYCSEEEKAETGLPEEKKGFLEKIKEKLPGQHKKGAEEETQTTAPAASEHSPGSEGKEKKGIIDIIKEKLPGQRKNNETEV